jgi:hypothetical protein
VSPGSGLLRDTGEVVAGASVGGQGVAASRVVQLDAALRAGGAAGEGAVPLGTHRVEIADLPVFASLGLARTPAMVLGIDVPARPAPAPRRAPRAASGARPPLRAGAGPEAGRVGRSCLARAGAARRAERWPSASRAASCGCDSATQRDGAWWRQRPRGAEAARGRGSSSAGTALHFDKTHCAPPAPTTRRREHARSSTAREGTARARGRRERPGRRGTGAPPAARRWQGPTSSEARRRLDSPARRALHWRRALWVALLASGATRGLGLGSSCERKLGRHGRLGGGVLCH